MARATFFILTILSSDLPVCMCCVNWLQEPPSYPVTGPLSPPSPSPPSFSPSLHVREKTCGVILSQSGLFHTMCRPPCHHFPAERGFHSLWGVKLDSGHGPRVTCLSTDGHLCWFHTWCAGVSTVLLTSDSAGTRCSWIIWRFYLQKLSLHFL